MVGLAIRHGKTGQLDNGRRELLDLGGLERVRSVVNLPGVAHSAGVAEREEHVTLYQKVFETVDRRRLEYMVSRRPSGRRLTVSGTRVTHRLSGIYSCAGDTGVY